MKVRQLLAVSFRVELLLLLLVVVVVVAVASAIINHENEKTMDDGFCDETDRPLRSGTDW